MATRSRTRRTAAAVAAFGLVTMLGGTARASDFCIEYTISNLLFGRLVGKGFRMPGPGRCKPFNGFGQNAMNGNVLTGAACTASTGDMVHFAFTQSYPSGDFGIFHVDLKLPLGQGGSIREQWDDGTFNNVSDPEGVTCPTTMSVP